MKTVYLDVVFFVNLLSDFILLNVTARFLLINITIKQLIASSVAGAVFSCVTAVLVNSQMLVFLLSLPLVYLMCRIGFGKSNTKNRVRQIVIMYTFSYILCGSVSLVSSLVNRRADSNIKSIVVMLCSLSFLFLWKKILPFFRNRLSATSVKSMLVLDDEIFNLTLLSDSGNLLVDNVSGLPVILIKDIHKKVNSYPIFVKTVTGSKMLWGKVPERLSIKTDDTYKEIKCCVAFAEDDDTFDGFDGIVPSAILESL